MRPTLVLVPLAPLALVLGLPLLAQDPGGTGGDEPGQDEPTSGFDGLFGDERARLEREIEGTWLLQEFQPVDGLFDAEDVRGAAIFRDGYLSVNVIAQTFAPEFLGDGRQLYVQGGAHRYRISEFLELQTAAIYAFQNFADEDRIVVEPSGLPREYRVEIDEESEALTMTASNGTRLTWSRLTETEFPVESLDALNTVRDR